MSDYNVMQVQYGEFIKAAVDAVNMVGGDAPERIGQCIWHALGGAPSDLEPDGPGLYVTENGRGFLKTATGYWLNADGSQLCEDDSYYDTPTGCGKWSDVCRELSFDDFPLHPAKPVAEDE